MLQLSMNRLMDARIELVGEMELVGIRGIEEYETKELLLEQLNEHRREIPHQLGTDTYVVELEDGLMVGVRVAEVGELPQGMVPYTIPSAEYTVFRFEAPDSDLIWQHLHLPEVQASYDLDGEAPRFEVIRNRGPEDGGQEIFVPVRAREVKVVALGELKLVGLPLLARNRQEVEGGIRAAMKELAHRLQEIQGLTAAEPLPMIGVFVPAEETQEGSYLLCTQVEDFTAVPDGMAHLTVPVQSYATTLHQGSSSARLRAWEQLDHWIALQGYERIQRAWHLEIYETFDAQADLVHVTLYSAVTV
ncbi:putative transcriptional regulator YdeE [Paenibacillus phyllosphaerae]|uniref:Putative transcriptional regulator YdeE n=1 Tax=Paenibacillus phyllosphaerae TaxID=274593 RepID=A0A7W5B1E0_9BACL|nr:effector binding domain-containing protein [Paenibacillus phyllosphaerae]MBB3112669.1 putative transcriptional regulator YdeE [Paenibacillus phyllosphaerae]